MYDSLSSAESLCRNSQHCTTHSPPPKASQQCRTSQHCATPFPGFAAATMLNAFDLVSMVVDTRSSTSWRSTSTARTPTSRNKCSWPSRSPSSSSATCSRATPSACTSVSSRRGRRRMTWPRRGSRGASLENWYACAYCAIMGPSLLVLLSLSTFVDCVASLGSSHVCYVIMDLMCAKDCREVLLWWARHLFL